jgi:prepilin-type processing-associated H-X9-DG protein
MKIIVDAQRNRGLTLADVLVVVVTLAVLVILLAPILFGREFPAQRINCMNDLKQIGLALQIWEGNHSDQYPMRVSVTNGGAMEPVTGGDALPAFQVMSNELGTPKFLVCPADRFCTEAKNFILTSKNVSYFISPECIEANPQSIISGDDSFEVGRVVVKSGLLEISSNTPIRWSAARHKSVGNLLFADGSVLAFDNSGLTNWLASTNFAATRLAIP